MIEFTDIINNNNKGLSSISSSKDDVSDMQIAQIIIIFIQLQKFN